MPAKVLIVEDSIVSGHILRKIIEQEDYTVIISVDGKNLVELIKAENVDIVLLNIVLPELNGFDLLNILMNTEETKDIPVIIVSSATSALEVKKALDAGAMDFIRKTAEPIEIIARVHSALKLKEKQSQLIQSSQRDHLTQLFNKYFFNITLEKQIRDASMYPMGIGLVMLDCDNFKDINDQYGHTFGDFVLASVANAIGKSVKYGDYACRFGGEEFSTILLNVKPDQTFLIAERMRRNVEKMEMGMHGKSVTMTISCGVSHCVAGDGKTGGQLVNEADSALYEAKRLGRNKTVLFTDIDVQPFED